MQTFNVGGEQVTVSQVGPSSYAVNDQTVPAGGVATAGGHTIALQPSGSAVVIDNSVTSPLEAPGSPTGAVVLPSATLQYTEFGISYVFGSQTLAPGGIATVSGQTISLGSSGVIVVDGTLTSSLPQPTTYVDGVVTIGGNIITFQEICQRGRPGLADARARSSRHRQWRDSKPTAWREPTGRRVGYGDVDTEPGGDRD